MAKFPLMIAAARSSILLLLLLIASLNAENDLAPLSDEFNYGPTITNWLRIYQTEGWGNDVLEQFDVNQTEPGRMFMMPYSSSWYEEFRGELTYKTVAGDFVITTEVEPTGRTGTGPPESQYSLAGIMVRTPRTMTAPEQWTPGGQNYIFLSLGSATDYGYQYEVKTTRNSISVLDISSGASARATIQVARLGAHFITLRRNQGGVWQVHRRYHRADMPDQLQAGLTVYTDWPLCSSVGFENQNTQVLTNGAPLLGGGTVSGANPGLRASFDYVRYGRPQIPSQLIGANFSDPASVSDAQLLSFLGANANLPHLPPPVVDSPIAEDRERASEGFPIRVRAAAGLVCIVQATDDFIDWITLTNFAGTGLQEEILTAGSHSFRFYRAEVTP